MYTLEFGQYGAYGCVTVQLHEIAHHLNQIAGYSGNIGRLDFFEQGRRIGGVDRALISNYAVALLLLVESAPRWDSFDLVVTVEGEALTVLKCRRVNQNS